MSEIPVDFEGKLNYFKLNVLKKSVRILLNTINFSEDYNPRDVHLKLLKYRAYQVINDLKRYDNETNLENFKEFLKKIVNLAVYLLDNDELYKEIFFEIIKPTK